jgi:hypothetical protein
MKPGEVVRLNSRELHIIHPGRPGWVVVIRVRGWLRTHLEVTYKPVPTRPDPMRNYLPGGAP